MSKADLAKRKRGLMDKKIKLQNPNFFVSKTRLSIRNIPLTLNESDLKSLFRKHSGDPPGVIRQVKIVREKDRFDADGKPRSKGYGFVEFAEHQPALAALRALNNHPSVWNKNTRPIVEFAVENVVALQKLATTKVKGRHSNQDAAPSSTQLTKRARPSDSESLPRKKPKLEKSADESTDTKKNSNSKPTKEKKKELESKPSPKPQTKPKPTQAPAPVQAPARQRVQQRLKKFPGDVQIAKPKPKAKEDKFDNIVANYKRKILQVASDSTKGHKKWYE
jgi:nucleolar protein 4